MRSITTTITWQSSQVKTRMKLELKVSVILNYISHSALLQIQVGQDLHMEPYTCQDGEEVPSDSCNRYMIGARPQCYILIIYLLHICDIFVEESKVLLLSINITKLMEIKPKIQYF